LHIRIPYPTSLPAGTGKDGWEQVDMLWCQGAQNIVLSNHKLKSALNAPYDHNAHQSQTSIDSRTHRALIILTAKDNPHDAAVVMIHRKQEAQLPSR